jgi:parallel beta-helix repeat protein
MKIFESVAQMKLAHLNAGQLVETKSYYNLSAPDIKGASSYRVVTSAEYGGSPDEYRDHTLANGNIAVLVFDGYIHLYQTGVRADGVTNDTNATQSGINSGASMVEAPIGVMPVDGLTLEDNQEIKGAGFVTVFYLTDGSNSHVMYGLAKNNIKLTSFKIDGNQVNQTSNDKHGIFLDTCDGYRIDSIEVTDIEKHAIILDDCSNGDTLRCDIHDVSDGTNVGHAYVLTSSSGSSQGNRISGCRIDNCPKGILLENSGTIKNRVDGNNISNITAGFGIFPFQGAAFNIIALNYVRTCIWEGIENHTSDYNIVSLNTCVDNGFNGIELFQSNSCAAASNVCVDNGTGGTFSGIRLTAENAASFTRFNTVTGNVCVDSGSATQFAGIDNFETGGGTVEVNTYNGNVCNNNTTNQLNTVGDYDILNANIVSSTGLFANLSSVTDVSAGELQLKQGVKKVDLSGAGTITTLPTTLPNGYSVTFKTASTVTFKDVSAGGNMQCPGNVDLVTNANDMVRFTWFGTDWHCDYYTND